MNKPAILGGKPAFDRTLPIIKPNMERYSETLSKDIKGILDSNMLTSVDIYLKRFEDKMHGYLGVRNAVGVSACTSGLIMTQQALGIRNADVLVPAFTFSATIHSLHWNSNRPVFVDIDDTFTVSVDDIQEKITDKTKAIMGVHMYGNPCDIDALSEIAEDKGIKMIYDAAHAIGASYKGRKIGNFGDAEVFSLSPTKLLTTIEGGIVSTNDDELAAKIKVDRNYGNEPDYSCKRPGLNARMSEINAAIGLRQIDDLDSYVRNRNEYVGKFKKRLASIPGITFQELRKDSVSTHKDFGFVVDKEEFGMDRNRLAEALKRENIMTKFYFYPPMHEIEAYRGVEHEGLEKTELVSNNIISLPIHNFMEDSTIERVALAIDNIQKHGKEIKRI